jgi:hypothetical protein
MRGSWGVLTGGREPFEDVDGALSYCCLICERWSRGTRRGR